MQFLFGDQPAIFQQDNDLSHMAKVVKEWADANAVNILSWSGDSPDLNSKENVWDYLGRKMKKENFKSGKELQEKLKGKWEKIPLAYLEMMDVLSPPYCLSMLSNLSYNS